MGKTNRMSMVNVLDTARSSGGVALLVFIPEWYRRGQPPARTTVSIQTLVVNRTAKTHDFRARASGDGGVRRHDCGLSVGEGDWMGQVVWV